MELVQGQCLRGNQEKSRLIWLAGFWTPSALSFAILLEILQKGASQPSSVQGSSSTCPISPGCSQPEGAQDKFQTSHTAAGLQHGIISSCQVLLSESLSLTLWHSSVTKDFTCCASLFSCREQGWEYTQISQCIHSLLPPRRCHRGPDGAHEISPHRHTVHTEGSVGADHRAPCSLPNCTSYCLICSLGLSKPGLCSPHVRIAHCDLPSCVVLPPSHSLCGQQRLEGTLGSLLPSCSLCGQQRLEETLLGPHVLLCQLHCPAA